MKICAVAFITFIFWGTIAYAECCGTTAKGQQGCMTFTITSEGVYNGLGPCSSSKTVAKKVLKDRYDELCAQIEQWEKMVKDDQRYLDKLKHDLDESIEALKEAQ